MTNNFTTNFPTYDVIKANLQKERQIIAKFYGEQMDTSCESSRQIVSNCERFESKLRSFETKS